MYRCQISIQKDVPHYMSSGKFKLKQQWDTTTYWLEQPKSKVLTTPNADEDMRHQEMQNGTATVEDCWAAFYKTKLTLTIISG